MKVLHQLFTIIRKDLLLESRSKEIITSMIVFSLMVMAIFNFIFEPGSMQIRSATPGILWVAFIFSGSLGLSRSFALEQDNAMMRGLLLCPVDKSVIYVAKVSANILFMTCVQLISLPVLIVLFDVDLLSVLIPLLLILFLGSAGFAGVGTIFATISANTKSREVMLPILLFPVSIPVILSAVKSTTCLLVGNQSQQLWSWLKILIAFDLIFIILSFLLYEYVLEE
jgi:heme exporter protein B